MSTRQVCTFLVGSMKFGIDVLHVQEVIRYQEITHVPLAPHAVVGLINLRGQIVTAIDMHRRLGLEARPDGDLPMNVVMRKADGTVSLLVDAIGDVVEVRDDALELPPETLDAATREVVKWVYKLDDGLLLMVDADAVSGRRALDAA